MKAKKILSMLLAALLVVAMLPMGIIGAGAANAGLTGTGAENDPYKIWDLAGYCEFVVLSKTIDTTGVYVELAADIDFVNRQTFYDAMVVANNAYKAANNAENGPIPEITFDGGETYELNPYEFSIGQDGNRVAGVADAATDQHNNFKGSFDGKNFALKNYTVSLREGQGGSWFFKENMAKSVGAEVFGIFAQLNGNATVKNLVIDGASVNFASGGWCGFLTSRHYANSNTTIENVTIKNTSFWTSGDLPNLLGIAHTNSVVNVKNITVENTKVTGNGGWSAVGLFARAAAGSTINLENVVMNGVTLSGKRFAAPFVGQGYDNSTLNFKGTNTLNAVDYFYTGTTADAKVDAFVGRDTAKTTVTGQETVAVKDYWAGGYKTNVEVTEDAYLLKITPAVSGAIKNAAGGYGLIVNGDMQNAVQAIDGVATIELTADQLDEEFDVVLVYVGEDNQPVVVNDCALNDVTFNKALVNADKATQDYIYSMDAYEAATAAYFAGEEVADNAADYEAVADIAVEGESANVAYQGTSLVLGETVAVRVYFTYLEDKDPTTLIATIDGMLVDVIDKGDGWYYVEIAGLKMKNLDATYAVVVDGITVTTSVYSYCKALAAAEDANAANLGAAIYNYAVASKAFLPADVVEEV